MQFSPQWFTKGYKSSTIKIFITFTQTSLIFTKLSKHLFFFSLYIYTLEKNGLNGRPTQYYQWLHIQLYINKSMIGNKQIKKYSTVKPTVKDIFSIQVQKTKQSVVSLAMKLLKNYYYSLSAFSISRYCLKSSRILRLITYMSMSSFGACWHCQIVLAVINLSFAKLPLITVYKHVCP